MASRSSPVPRRRASSAGPGEVKNSTRAPDIRPGYLQRDRDLERPASLNVHKGVKHGLGAVEVGGQPPALVAVQQRVQPDMHLALQVRGEHGGVSGR